MAITITSFVGVGPFTTGAGGSQVPAAIRVTGTLSKCQTGWVSSTCTTTPVSIPIAGSGGTQSWTVDLPNDKKCACGAEITVSAQCNGETPVFATGHTLQCGDCPVATNASVQVSGTCHIDQGVLKRDVQLSVTVQAPAAQAVTAQWTLREILTGGGLGSPIPGPSFGAPAGAVSAPAAQVPPGPQVIALVPGNYQAELDFLFPFQNCPGIAINVQVPACPTTTTTTSTTSTTNPPCPQVTVLFTEGPCDAQGNRQVTATAQVTGAAPTAFYWQWDIASQSHQGGSTDAVTLPGGTTHTVQLAIVGPGGCFTQAPPATHPVSPCPVGTTTTSTTSTSTSTSTTTSSTTTSTSTSTTTSSTTPAPSSGGMGCLCILLLLIAMGLLASAAITFLTWAFGGMLSAGLLATASTLAVAAIAILVLWILVCRDCPAIRYLGGIFAVLAVAMLIAAGILALSGMPQGAVGALIDWALFTLVVAVLSGVGKRVGC